MHPNKIDSDYKIYHLYIVILSQTNLHIKELWALSLCNFSCNLQRNSTLNRYKFVTNVSYVINMSANFDGNLPILHRTLQEKLRRVTGPYILTYMLSNK